MTPAKIALRCLVARMAADGSWAHEATREAPFTPAARERIVASILANLDEQ